jgi:hypothetical protein
VELETQAIAARMIADQIRDEYVKIGGRVDCGVTVNYQEDTGEWEARAARDELTVNERRTFVTAVNGVEHKHKWL